MVKDEEVVMAFYDVHRLNRRSYALRHDGVNIYKGQYHCLFVLENAEAVAQKELAELLHIRPTSVGELLSRLEQKGWVRRTSSKTDKRKILVSLTDMGKAEVKRARRENALVQGEMLSPLTVEENAAFYRILEKIRSFYLETEGEER